MGTLDHLHDLARRWPVLAAVGLMGLTVGAGVFFLSPRSYEATTTIYVSTLTGTDASELQQRSTFSERQAITYADLATTPAVLNPVIDELDLEVRTAQLAERIEADAVPDTTLLRITANADDPELAARITEAIAASLSALSEGLVSPPTTSAGEAGIVPVIELSVVRPTEASSAPTGPGLVPTLILGLGGGVILGGGLISLRESIGKKVRGHADVLATTNLPVLGATTRTPRRRGGESPQHREGRHGNIAHDVHNEEDYRTLRASLQFTEPFGSPCSYVVTSSIRGEGTSTVAANLARSMSKAGRKTLLIDADLVESSLAGRLGIPAEPGLTDVISGRVSMELAMVRTNAESLWVMPAGAPVPAGDERIPSQMMQSVLERCTDDFDVIILDTPPLRSVSDAAVLAQLTTGVLLVVRAGAVETAELSAAVRLLEQAHARVIGTVLTMLPATDEDPDRRRRSSLRVTPIQRSHPGPEAGAKTDGRRSRNITVDSVPRHTPRASANSAEPLCLATRCA